MRPAKAGLFSRRQSCRGKSQSPVAWIADRSESDDLKPIDKPSLREGASHRAVTKVNADVASKTQPRRLSPRYWGESSMGSRNLTDAADHFGGV